MKYNCLFFLLKALLEDPNIAKDTAIVLLPVFIIVIGVVTIGTELIFLNSKKK